MPNTTTPADELRTAAEKLRRLATTVSAPDDRDQTFHADGRTVTQGRSAWMYDVAEAATPELADYLSAFASPLVGLGVARWLEQTANEITDCGGFAAGAVDGPMSDRDHNTWSSALAVARAINGTQPAA